MCTRVTVVCLSVCVCVCYRSSAIIRRLCDKLNLPDRSSLNSEGFQLVNIAKMLSLPSYSLFFALARRRQPFWNIEVAAWRSIDDHYQRALNVGKRLSALKALILNNVYAYTCRLIQCRAFCTSVFSCSIFSSQLVRPWVHFIIRLSHQLISYTCTLPRVLV